MLVPHNALVLVADGRTMRFLRNEGTPQALQLTIEQELDHVSRKDRDQKSGPAGRAAVRSGAHGGGGQFASGGGGIEETDFHQQEEDRFAAEIGAMLEQRALSNDFDALIVAAPAKTLGELRKHYHRIVSERLAGEVVKDFTHQSPADLEQALLELA